MFGRMNNIVSALALTAMTATPVMAKKGDERPHQHHQMAERDHEKAERHHERGERHHKADHDRGDRDDDREKIAQTVNGQVSHMLVNPYGEVDGLLLTSGAVVRFPAHMSSQLVSTVRRGDQVAVQGTARRGGQQIRGRVIRNNQSKKVVTVAPKPWTQMKLPEFIRYSRLTPMTQRGKITQIIAGKHGNVKALLLADGTTARMAKAIARQAPALQPGMSVAISGRGTATPHGRGIEVETIKSL